MSSVEMKNQEKSDNPGVRMPPPIIVAVFLGLGIWLNNSFHLSFVEHAAFLRIVGIGLIGVSVGLMLWCAKLYRQAQTSILPHTADNTLMDHGPFSFSRNPIYVAMIMMFMGLSLVMDAPLALLFLLPAILALRFYVIAKEEAYLERRFGENYLEYKGRVRRWI